MFDKTGPSVVISGPGTATTGHGVTFKAKVTDPFPGGFAVHYVWKWGDGTTSTTSTGSASHAYKSAGTRTITLTVTDNYLGTGTATHQVKVAK
jgi:PKD repeat protein